MADKKKVNSIGGLGGLLKNDIFSYPAAIQQQHNVYIAVLIVTGKQIPKLEHQL